LVTSPLSLSGHYTIDPPIAVPLPSCQVISNIGSVCRIAVPMVLYFSIMWISTFVLFNKLG
jgi:ACR3 family arsenite efflux pump ArsB